MFVCVFVVCCEGSGVGDGRLARSENSYTTYVCVPIFFFCYRNLNNEAVEPQFLTVVPEKKISKLKWRL
jgi:hypothetical protein